MSTIIRGDIEWDVSDEAIAALDLAKCKIVRQGPRLDRKLPLAVLRDRQDLTQAQVAKKARMTQSDVSRAEQRSDCLVSTLERYAKALGGKLRLVIEIGDHAYSIGLQSPKKARR
jgi:hypothetical protein